MRKICRSRRPHRPFPTAGLCAGPSISTLCPWGGFVSLPKGWCHPGGGDKGFCQPQPVRIGGIGRVVSAPSLPSLRLGTGTRRHLSHLLPCPISKVPVQMKAPCCGAQETGLSPISKAPELVPGAERNVSFHLRPGVEAALSSPPQHHRRSFEGSQSPPTCPAGAVSGVCCGAGGSRGWGAAPWSSALQGAQTGP